MDLVRLRYFRTGAKTLRFRRAASLFERFSTPAQQEHQSSGGPTRYPTLRAKRRHVELTPAGQILLALCEKIFQELKDAQSEVKRYADGEKGSIRIGCKDGTTFGVLPPAP